MFLAGILATGALLSGIFFFFEYPVFGVILIAIGHYFAYMLFKHTAQPLKTTKKKREKKEKKRLEKIKTEAPQTMVNTSLRPTRVMGIPSPSAVAPMRNTIPSKTVVTGNSEKYSLPSEENEAEKSYEEGMLYCTGNDGREIDYDKAEECFRKSKEQGYPQAEEGLAYLNQLR